MIPRTARQLYRTGDVVVTPTHRYARLTHWRDDHGKWDAYYLKPNTPDGAKGEPTILDPRQCIPL